MDKEIITVVSGLPRSGTSMMMKMLISGGMDPLTDNLRVADEDNLKGYFEFEMVKSLDKDTSWLKEAQGKVVKIISPLLKHLPPAYTYQVVFMRRKMDEILASQQQMLIRRGVSPDKVGNHILSEKFQTHLEETEAWLAKQQNLRTIFVNYNEVLKEPAKNAERVNRFLGSNLIIENMLEVVESSLYRQRK